jgi:hypothetical protein
LVIERRLIKIWWYQGNAQMQFYGTLSLRLGKAIQCYGTNRTLWIAEESWLSIMDAREVGTARVRNVFWSVLKKVSIIFEYEGFCGGSVTSLNISVSL